MHPFFVAKGKSRFIPASQSLQFTIMGSDEKIFWSLDSVAKNCSNRSEKLIKEKRCLPTKARGWIDGRTLQVINTPHCGNPFWPNVIVFLG